MPPELPAANDPPVIEPVANSPPVADAPVNPPELTEQPEPQSAAETGETYYELNVDGKKIPVTAQIADQLMQLGYKKAMEDVDKTEPEPEPEPEAITIEEKFAKLEAKVLKAEEDKKQEVEKNTTLNELDTAFANSSVGKERPNWDKSMKLEALAIQTLNPTVSIQQAMAAVNKDRENLIAEIRKESEVKAKPDRIMANRLGSLIASAGGVPTVTPEKPMTVEDVRNGTARKLLEGYLGGVMGDQ